MLLCCWILWETVATKVRSVQVQSCESCESNRRQGDGTSFDQINTFHTIIVYIRIFIQGSILVGLLKAHPYVGTVARPEDCVKIRRRDELKISRGTDAAFAGFSAHEDTCCPTFYNVPSLRRTSCAMHKNKRQLNFIKIFKEKYRYECEWHLLIRCIVR